MKILFQGDSITDAGRDRSDPHELGTGYPSTLRSISAASIPTRILNLSTSA